MTLMIIKHLHALCALLSITGFFLRGIWMLRDSPLFRARLTRVLPHIVDTCLLVSALGLLWLYQWNPFDHAWLSAKILALLVYIGLGLCAFRFAANRRQQALYWLAALTSGLYILAVAITKSPLLNLL